MRTRRTPGTLRAEAVHRDVAQRRREFPDMDITARARTPLLILAMLVALAGCFGSGATKPGPSGPTPEQQKQEAEHAELERLRAEEAQRQAQDEANRKAAQEAEKQKEAAALPAQFGTAKPPDAAAQPPSEATPESKVPPVIAGTAAADAEAPTVPYDQAFPPIPDRVLRVAVVSAPSQANVAERIGTMLSVTERESLERALGMGLKIAYLSQKDRDPKQETRIKYREKYLQAAVQLAGKIPQAQRVERMRDEEATRMGVDVLIQVGSDIQ